MQHEFLGVFTSSFEFIVSNFDFSFILSVSLQLFWKSEVFSISEIDFKWMWNN